MTFFLPYIALSPVLGADGFADAEPSALQQTLIILFAVISGIGSVVGIAIAVLTLVRMIRGKNGVEITPNPLRMQKEQPPATQFELNALGTRMEKDLDELRDAMQREREAAREAIGNLHRRIDVVAENTASIKGTLDSINATVRALLDRAMGFVPAERKGPRAG